MGHFTVPEKKTSLLQVEFSDETSQTNSHDWTMKLIVYRDLNMRVKFVLQPTQAYHEPNILILGANILIKFI
jgi:hypothetical protein